MTSHRENKVLSYAFNVFCPHLRLSFSFVFCVSAIKVLLHPTLPLARCLPNDPAPALRQAGQLPSPSAQQLPTTYDLRPTTYDLRPTTYDLRPTTYDLRPTTYDPRLNNYQLLFGLPASTNQRPTEKVLLNQKEISITMTT
ncbi:hypothetical protein QOT17_007153 [Balamuthia mandrillaris]